MVVDSLVLTGGGTIFVTGGAEIDGDDHSSVLQLHGQVITATVPLIRRVEQKTLRERIEDERGRL